MTIQYKRTYLAMQQVQRTNQIYEFMPSSLPIHVFESILPAQCLYKTKAYSQFVQETMRFPLFNMSVLVPKNMFLSLERYEWKPTIRYPAQCMDQRNVETELKVAENRSENLKLQKSRPNKLKYACSMQNAQRVNLIY